MEKRAVLHGRLVSLGGRMPITPAEPQLARDFLGEGCQDKAKLQEIIQKVKEAWWQERSELEEAVAKIESRDQGQRREAVEVAAPPAKKPRRTITKAHPATGAAAEMLSCGIDAPPPSLCNVQAKAAKIFCR